MDLFVDILTEVTLPIVVIVAIGYASQRYLALDVSTLTQLQLNIILPAFFLHALSSASLPLAAVWPTVWFTVVQFLALLLVGWTIALMLGIEKEFRPIVALATAFPNSGNFGIPVAELAFPADYLVHQAVIVSMHTFLIVAIGIPLLSGRSVSLRGLGELLFKTPMIIAIVLGLTLRGLDLRLPRVLDVPAEVLGSAFTPIALFTLGAYLANATVKDLSPRRLSLMLVLKLLLAPALTWAALLPLGFEPTLTALLVVASAAPIGVLLAIFATEYEREADIVSAAVFLSTALSPIIVTAWILLTRL